jgi:hypothetical protein
LYHQTLLGSSTLRPLKPAQQSFSLLPHSLLPHPFSLLSTLVQPHCSFLLSLIRSLPSLHHSRGGDSPSSLPLTEGVLRVHNPPLCSPAVSALAEPPLQHHRAGHGFPRSQIRSRSLSPLNLTSNRQQPGPLPSQGSSPATHDQRSAPRGLSLIAS